jgi:hypothetical protein
MKWTFEEYDNTSHIDIERLLYYLNTEQNTNRDGEHRLKIQIIVGGSEDAVRKIKSVDDAIGGASGSGGLIRSFTLGNLAATAITKGVELAANAVADFGRMAVNTLTEAYNLATGMQQTGLPLRF